MPFEKHGLWQGGCCPLCVLHDGENGERCRDDDGCESDEGLCPNQFRFRLRERRVHYDGKAYHAHESIGKAKHPQSGNDRIFPLPRFGEMDEGGDELEEGIGREGNRVNRALDSGRPFDDHGGN